MIKYRQPYSFLFFLAFLVSCYGQQKKANLSNDSSVQNEIVRLKPIEIDPYFTESSTLNSSNGPTSITRNILQDNNGNFWFASWQGIFGYDGTSFTNFTNKEGLRRFRAFSLLEDKSGVIWFGIIGAGLYKYDPSAKNAGGKTFINLTTDDGLVNNDVGCIYQDTKDNIWFGTRVGISIYDGKSFHNYTTSDGLTNNDINAIVEDDNGVFWIAARGEACTFDGKTFTKVTTKAGKSFENLRSIIKDKEGTMWLGGNDGLWNYNGSKFTNFTSDFIGNIYEDRNGTIWFSKSDPNDTYTMTLCKLVTLPLPAKGSNITNIVSGEGQVFGIIEDDAGNIWFGTERGACKYDGSSFDYFNSK